MLLDSRKHASFTPKPKKTLLVMDAIPQFGVELFALAVELKLEGLVAKRKDSIYEPGERTAAWRKIKVPGRCRRSGFVGADVIKRASCPVVNGQGDDCR